ncbi:hypothetical protein, partial [Streptomyces albogriseolus]|uniref:hypothetical protein n=1 Tax=Streptomyces albogriseolus TaxID=1887 RepID=UPI0037FE9BA9
MYVVVVHGYAARGGFCAAHRCWKARMVEPWLIRVFLARSGSSRSSLQVISFGESAVADEGAGEAGEGEEVLGLAFVA